MTLSKASQTGRIQGWRMSGIGVPIKLLHETQGLMVSVELKTGQIYRGKLAEVEDNMNIQLREITVTARDGKVSAMEHCFLRGSHIRFIVVPDNLRHAPMFKNFSNRDKKGKGLGMGRARAEVARAVAIRGGRGALGRK